VAKYGGKTVQDVHCVEQTSKTVCLVDHKRIEYHNAWDRNRHLESDIEWVEKIADGEPDHD
jgi:hypothetical protein